MPNKDPGNDLLFEDFEKQEMETSLGSPENELPELDFLGFYRPEEPEREASEESAAAEQNAPTAESDALADEDALFYEPIALSMEEAEDKPKKRSFRELFRFRAEEADGEPEADDGADEAEESVEESEEESKQSRFGLRRLFSRPTEPEEDFVSEEEREALFAEPSEDEAEAQDEAEDEVEDERFFVKNSIKGALSFFSGGRRPKAPVISDAEEDANGKADEEPEEEIEAAPRKLAVHRASSEISAVRRSIPREPTGKEMLVYDSELDSIDYDDADDIPERRDYLPVRFRRYGSSGIGGGLMYAIFIISLSIVLACAFWMFAADVLALSKDYVESVVVVESYVPKEGDLLNADGEAVDEDGNVITCDIEQVAAALHEGEIIDFEFLFKLFSKVSHAYYKIDPGTYDVSTRLDYRALVTEMQTGSESQEVTRITFPEGYTIDQIFAKLEENNICDAEDLYEAAAEHDFKYSWLEDIPLGEATRLEGYLFPDTYDFYQGENAVNVLNRFLLRFHGIITADMYQQAENQGITLHDAVIIASLIEKEAGPEDDRGNFSSVILKRLRNDWPLQLDSTINYINNTSTFNISYADLETDSPYNTYLYAGLPAGPICSPGLASLNAALNPNSTDYWYWYAYDGVSYFFSDSSDFNNFAAEHPVD